jgi:hypothetical protein
MTEQTGYDATRDPRTGRPVLPLDAENARKAEVESEPLTNEDNQGISIEDEENPNDMPGIGGEDDLLLPLKAENEDADSSSAEELNSTAPRMKGPDIESEDLDEDVIDRNV